MSRGRLVLPLASIATLLSDERRTGSVVARGGVQNGAIAATLLLIALLVPLGCTNPPVHEPVGYVYSDWSTPENLGSVVNSGSNDQHPAISPDGLSLYFHSDRTGNIDGSVAGTSDIWVAHRTSAASPWGAPINLGPIVNSTTNDTAPYLSPDGKSLYFGSDRTGGCGLRDIWVSHRTDVAVDLGAGGWESPTNLGCTINSAQNDDGPNVFVNPVNGQTTLYHYSNPAERPRGLGRLEQ